MVATRRNALDYVAAVIRSLFPMVGLEMDGPLRSGFARGQNNTFQQAIRISDINSAVETTVRDALYTRDVAGGLQDLVGHVRALELDAGLFGAREDVGIDSVGSGYKEPGFVNSDMGLELALPFRRERACDEVGYCPVLICLGVVAAE